MKKKTIIMSNYDSLKNLYYAGGGAVQTHRLGKALRNEYNVMVICGAYPGSQDETIDGVRYRYIGFKHAGPLAGQLLFSLLLPLYALKERYDLWIENFVPPHSTNLFQYLQKSQSLAYLRFQMLKISPKSIIYHFM